MTDRPILFRGPMVRAILDGRKTQTRRVVKLADDLAGKTFTGELANYYGDHRLGMAFEGSTRVQPIPYAPGDRLWVRETWAVGTIYDGTPPRDINPGGKPGWCGIRYAATDARKGIKDRPSIHMPRWASRLTLLVTDVRVQRLWDIAPEDAREAGVDRHSRQVRQIDLFGASAEQRDAVFLRACRWEFQDLWDSLNAKRGYGWDANPWVVAITFDVHRANIDQIGGEAEGARHG